MYAGDPYAQKPLLCKTKRAKFCQRTILIITFATMKSIIKIFLLTLLFCCYINTVFEFSDSEKEANFENESHYYILQDNCNTTTLTTKKVQHIDIAFYVPHLLNFSANWTTKHFNFFSQRYFSSPGRLFLLHSSLLI